LAGGLTIKQLILASPDLCTPLFARYRVRQYCNLCQVLLRVC